MTGDEFKQEIQSSPKNIYCLVSTDSAMIDLYLKRFVEAVKASKVVYGSIVSSNNLLQQKIVSVLYMPTIDETVFGRNEYIFIHTDSIDKRSSLYKKNKDYFIEVSNDYVEFVMRRGFSKKDAELFVKKCDNDLGLIKHALVIHKCGGEIPDYSNDIYQWVNSYIKNEPLPRVTESPIGVLALLSNTCQNMLKVSAGKTEGMNSYAVMKTKELLNYRTKKELTDIISTCFYLDSQVKRGTIEIDYILDYIILLGRREKDAITD